jgi:hypothetical protein
MSLLASATLDFREVGVPGYVDMGELGGLLEGGRFLSLRAIAA